MSTMTQEITSNRFTANINFLERGSVAGTDFNGVWHPTLKAT
jgi:hypothetical protein